MGLRDRITGGESTQREISHFELRLMYPGEGKWKVPEFDHDLGDLSDLQEELDQDAVKATAETEGWPTAKYKLQARYSDGTMAPTSWTFDHEGPDDADAEPELTPTERTLERMDRRLARLEERGAAPPEDLEGKLMHTMDRFESGDIDEETVGASVAMYEDVSRLIRRQEGDILDRIAERKLDEGDLDAAAKYQIAKRQADGASRGGLLQNVLEGDVNLEDEIGIKELIYLDAYHEFGDEVRELLRAQSAAYDGDSSALQNLIGAGGADDDDADDVDETPEAEPDEQIETGADLDLAPGVNLPGADADAAESAETPAEPADDPEPTPTDAPAEIDAEAPETPAEADGGGVEALEDDVEDDSRPGLADAAAAIREDEAGDEGGED